MILAQTLRNPLARVHVVFLCVSALITSTAGCDNRPGVPGTGDDNSGILTDSTLTPVDPTRDTLASTVIDEGDYTITANEMDGDPSTWKFVASSNRGRNDGELQFEWDFGDGLQATGPDQTYTFPGPGQYVVTVTAYYPNGRVAFVLTLEVEVAVLNEPPVANAGEDQTVGENDLIFLYGGASVDPDNPELTYLWTQGSGLPVNLLHTTEPTARFISPIVSEDTQLSFGLTVSDGEFTSQDTVVVTVLDSIAPASVGPSADAGPDQAVTELGLVTLDGTNSTGSGDSELTFEWFQVLGPTADVSDPNSAVVTFQAPDVADESIVLVFELVVTEGGLLASDEVNVTVLPDGSGSDGGGDGGGGGGVPDPPPCASDADCADGVYCNGVETCASGSCQPGTPVNCDDGVACTIDSCDEATTSCNNVPTDGLCDNGLFCDGTESCDQLLGCQAGSLVDCDDGVACTDDACNEGIDSCDNVTNNANCDDALYCNGAEICHATLGCQPGTAVNCDDGVACTTDSCNETTDSCDSAPDDWSCDNGLFCDGAETCDLVLGCLAGADPCPAQLCHENTDTCEDINCAGDADCDDNLFCNGAETCVSNICQPGAPVNCDDGVACTVDSCSEATSSCQNVATDALCDDGVFCDGSETCDSVLGCQAGNDPCPGEGCDEAGQMCVPPALSVNPLALSFGSTATDLTFEVWNSGGGTLSYTLSDGASWLTVSPSNGDSSGEHNEITATVDRSGLSDGQYQGEVTVTLAGAGIVVAVTVTMVVGACQPMTTASRTTGVAPLGIFFDAVDTTDPAWNSGVVQPGDGDYASFHYEWDFGDDPDATWATNGKSKNEAIGYVAAHVFEDSGTYTVMLTVTDPAGQTHDYCQVIQVDDSDVVFAGVKTRCVSSSGDFAGCPDGAIQVTSSDFRDQMVWLFSSNGPARVLFSRGETFASTSGFFQGARSGPYTIGDYGTGLKNPIVNSTHDTWTLSLQATVSDVRVVDVDFDGPYPGATPGAALGTGTDMLVLRSVISHHSSGVSHFAVRKDRNFFVDCTFNDNMNYGIFYHYGRHVAVLGSVFENVDAEHLLRTYITHSLIAHNTFRGGAGSKHQLKFVGLVPGEYPPFDEVEYSIISDNQFLDPGPVAWMITIGPQNNVVDQRVRHVVFERNVMEASSTTQVGVLLNSVDVTIRNNTFDGTGSTWYRAIAISRRGIEPPPIGNRVYNNTAYRDDAGSNFRFVSVSSDVLGATIINNLASAPNTSDSIMIQDLGNAAFVESNNLLTDTPGFADAGSGNFRLLGSSPAIDFGLALPHVLEDFDSARRGSPPEVGAFEFLPAP